MLTESSVCENCFREIFENANPRKLCPSKMRHYTIRTLYLILLKREREEEEEEEEEEEMEEEEEEDEEEEEEEMEEEEKEEVWREEEEEEALYDTHTVPYTPQAAASLPPLLSGWAPVFEATAASPAAASAATGRRSQTRWLWP